MTFLVPKQVKGLPFVSGANHRRWGKMSKYRMQFKSLLWMVRLLKLSSFIPRTQPSTVLLPQHNIREFSLQKLKDSGNVCMHMILRLSWLKCHVTTSSHYNQPHFWIHSSKICPIFGALLVRKREIKTKSITWWVQEEIVFNTKSRSGYFAYCLRYIYSISEYL